MTKSVRVIFFLFSLLLLIGIIIAYYNTASLGYDNANIVSFNNEEIRLFDYVIKYKDISYFIHLLKNLFNPQIVSI